MVCATTEYWQMPLKVVAQLYAYITVFGMHRISVKRHQYDIMYSNMDHFSSEVQSIHVRVSIIDKMPI